VIVTLTANPSVDRTLEIPALERGEVVRATAARVHPGGKGVNVARVLVANGHAARAVLPSGGREGDQLLDLLGGLGIDVVPVPIAEPIRENVTVVEPDGTVTKLNAPGPRLAVDEVEALVAATVRAADGAEWVALCGALPPGAPDDLYATLVSELHAYGIRVAVDASGAALAPAIEAGADLIKPNGEELSDVVGRPLDTLLDVVEAARSLLDLGVGHVLVSLGSEGAVSVSDTAAVRAWSEPVIPRSTVGAGDATLAGFLSADADGDPAEQLRHAVAWGAAAVRLPGTEMPGPADINPDEVSIEELEAGRVLDGRRRG
jgi:1-phosphofructokinase